ARRAKSRLLSRTGTSTGARLMALVHGVVDASSRPSVAGGTRGWRDHPPTPPPHLLALFGYTPLLGRLLLPILISPARRFGLLPSDDVRTVHEVLPLAVRPSREVRHELQLCSLGHDLRSEVAHRGLQLGIPLGRLHLRLQTLEPLGLAVALPGVLFVDGLEI